MQLRLCVHIFSIHILMWHAVAIRQLRYDKLKDAISVKDNHLIYVYGGVAMPYKIRN